MRLMRFEYQEERKEAKFAIELFMVSYVNNSNRPFKEYL